MTSPTELLAALDATAGERIVVFGSLPPAGRDLDLLVFPNDAAPLVETLSSLGFRNQGPQWARFSRCHVELVEIVTSDRWSLPAEEVHALFADAEPLDALERVVAPAPHHSLLILARRLQGRRALLTERHLRRAQAAARTDRAWPLAWAHADAWHVQRELARLQRSCASGRPDRPHALRRPRRPTVVALSGLDGAGKTSQATSLCQTLITLGHDAVVEWAPASQPRLRGAVNLARRLLGHAARNPAQDRSNPDLRAVAYPPLVAHAWTATSVALTAFGLWRSLLRHVVGSRVVICDRHALDFAVFLSYRHGGNRNLSFQLRLLRLLAPRPALTYLLDVDGETAAARKPEQFSVDELGAQAALYRELAAPFGAEAVDGEAPIDEICERLGQRVWTCVGKA